MNFGYMKKCNLVGDAFCSHTGARQKVLGNNVNFQNVPKLLSRHLSAIVVQREGTTEVTSLFCMENVTSAHDLVLILCRLNENIVLVNKQACEG